LIEALGMPCSICGAESYSEKARFCTKCGTPVRSQVAGPRQGAMRRFWRAIISGSSSFVGAAIAPRAGMRAPIKYVWRGRRGVLRASRSGGHTARGRPRPEIFHLPGLSISAKKVYFYLSRVSDVDGYAFPFVRTIAVRTSLSKTTVAHSLTEVEQAGLLTRVHRYSRRGGSSNVYRLSPPRE
jgi:DNA-binding transcriptional ArsR family regulator/ribosomal protein L37E